MRCRVPAEEALCLEDPPVTDDVADAGIVELGLRLAGRGLSTVDLGRALLARAEGTLLRVAHALQLATDWHRRRPPLAP